MLTDFMCDSMKWHNADVNGQPDVTVAGWVRRRSPNDAEGTGTPSRTRHKGGTEDRSKGASAATEGRL
jgi:hypothetical protein